MPMGKMPSWWRDYLHLTVRWSSNDNIMIPFAEVQPHMTSHSQPLQNHILGKHVDCFSGLVWRQKGVRRERQVITKLLLQLLLIRLFLLSRTTPEEMTDKLETFHIVFSCLQLNNWDSSFGDLPSQPLVKIFLLLHNCSFQRNMWYCAEKTKLNLQFFPFSINGLKPPLIGEVMVTMVDLWFPIAARLKAVWHQMVPLGPKSVELNAHQPPPCLSIRGFLIWMHNQ